jgi:hypothetical protein
MEFEGGGGFAPTFFLPAGALLAALALLVLLATFFLLLGLQYWQPKRQMAERVGRCTAFFFDMLLLFAHWLKANFKQK